MDRQWLLSGMGAEMGLWWRGLHRELQVKAMVQGTPQRASVEFFSGSKKSLGCGCGSGAYQ